MSDTGGKAPVESKVKAATVGAGAGAAIGTFIDWLVDAYVITPHHLDGNPAPVTALITLATSAAVAYVLGYLAKHTPRPDLGHP